MSVQPVPDNLGFLLEVIFYKPDASPRYVAGETRLVLGVLTRVRSQDGAEIDSAHVTGEEIAQALAKGAIDRRLTNTVVSTVLEI